MGPKLETWLVFLDKKIVYLKIRRTLSQKKKRIKKWQIRMHTLNRVWTLKQVMKLLNGSKNTWLVRNVQVLWELSVASVVCSIFQKQVSKSLFWSQVQMVSVLNSCLLLSTTNTIPSVKIVSLCVLTISSPQVRSPFTSLTILQLVKMNLLNWNRSLLVLLKVVCRLVQPLSVGKQLKCLACMVKMTMIWLVLLSVLQKNLKSSTVQK